jgi:hypothetical protein
MKRVAPRRGPSRKLSRGQAEVLGGLIVLTILFAMAVPLLLTYVQRASAVNQITEMERSKAIRALNEKVTIMGVQPTDPDFPAIWINNTGTITVQLDYLYLVDSVNKEIIYIIDLKYIRTSTIESNTTIKDIVRGIKFYGTSEPPLGQPITLQPGAAVKILINGTNPLIKDRERFIVVRVETVPGIIHPIQDLTSATLEPLPTLFGPSGGGGNVYLIPIFNLSNITELPAYDAYMVLPGYIVTSAGLKIDKKSQYGTDPRYPPFNYYTYKPKIMMLYAYKLKLSNGVLVVDKVCYQGAGYQGAAQKIVLRGAYLAESTTFVSKWKDHEEDDRKDKSKVKLEDFMALATDYMIYIWDEASNSWVRANTDCSGPALIITQAPEDAIQLIPVDLDGDGVADKYEILFNTTQAYYTVDLDRWKLDGIVELNFTVNFTIETSNIAVMLVDIKFSANFTRSPTEAYREDVGKAAKYDPPLLALVLYKNGTPIAYVVKTYKDVIPNIEKYKIDNFPLWVSGSLSDMLYNLPPGDYQLSIIVFDALPGVSVELLIEDLSLSILAAG